MASDGCHSKSLAADLEYTVLTVSISHNQPLTVEHIGALMTSHSSGVCERLKRLGFAQQNRMKLYGEEFELLSDPFIVGNDLVFVDAIERKSRQQRRVRIPLPIVKMANQERRAA